MGDTKLGYHKRYRPVKLSRRNLRAWYSFKRRHLATRRQRLVASVMVVILLAGIVIPIIASQRHASAWWNGSWTYRRAITINNTASSTTLTNFPIRVSLTSSNITYANTKAAGADIRFVDGDDTTALSYQIETWNSSGTSEIWVKIPSLTATNYTIYMYYGNSSATDAQAATSVWDTSYKGVWHLSESGNGTVGEYKDSTSNANNGRGGNGTATNAPTQAAGQMGKGESFDNVSDYIQVPNSASIGITTDISITGWIKRSATTDYGPMFEKGDGSTANDYDFYMCHTSGECASPNNNSFGFYSDGTTPGGASGGIANTTQITDTTTWHYVAVVRTGGTLNMYLDGSLDKSTSMTGNFPNNAYPLLFGVDNKADSTAYFAGTMDEFRLTSGARSADWIKADYLTGTNTMNSFSAEQTQTPDAPVNATISSPSSAAPVFQMRANDPINPSYLRYKVDVCTTSNCSNVLRTADQTASQTGWSGQDSQTSTAYAAGTPGTPAFVQAKSPTSDSGSTAVASAATTFTSSTTTGNFIVAAVSFDTNTTQTFTCSDNKGNTYTTVAIREDTTNKQASGLCYATNITGGASHTVTATFGASTTFTTNAIQEYSGVATSNALDVTSTNFATGTSATSGAATTTQANDLVFGFLRIDDGTLATIGAGSGFTSRVGVSQQSSSEDMILATAGSTAATFSLGTSRTYTAVMAAFRSANQQSTLATYTYQSPALSAGTQYWWRSYAIDPSGSNVWSPPSTISTFTTSANGSPAAPNNVSPTSGATGVSTTPTFTARTTDVDSDYLRYKIDICSTSDCSSIVRTVDQTSSQTGWSGQDAQTGTAYAANSVTAVSYLQSNSYTLNPPTPGVASISQSFSSNVASNSLVIAYSRWGTSPASTLTSCSDTLGNTYTVVQQQNNTTDSQGDGSCYAVNTNGAGADTVTMTYSNSATVYPAMIIAEYANVKTTGPLDVYSQAFSATGTGSTTTDGVSSGAATTTANGDLIVGNILEKGTVGTDTPGTGFTQRLYTGLSQAYLEDKIQSSAGSVAATMTFGTLNHWGANMMAFKAATTTSTLATYAYQAPSLSSNTQYWWRSYAIDPGGTNTFGPASAISTFTTSATHSAPAAPTLIIPNNAMTGVSLSPEFRLYTTDADQSDVQYKIQVCSVSDCSSVVRTIDQTASQTGWTSQNSGSGTRYTASSILSGSQQAIHIYQSPLLSPSTQYWWRAYAIDPLDVNTFSSASSINTFTTGSSYGENVGGGSNITGGSNIGR